MKSITTPANERKERPYPKLMRAKDNNMIVLFVSDFAGTVVNQGESPVRSIGEHSANFNSFAFVDYEGSVTLSND